MKTSTLPAGPAADRSTDWLDHAACRRSDPELFFPITDIRAARAHVEAVKKRRHLRHLRRRILGDRWRGPGG